MRAPGGPRLLLRRLREVMAEPVTAQARLDRMADMEGRSKYVDSRGRLLH